MSQHIGVRRDPVPRIFWLMVGGNSLSPPPTWDHFLHMTGERTKVERAAKAEEQEFKEAKKQAMAELKAQKKANKEAFKGGPVAWRKRTLEAKANGDGGDKQGSSQENLQLGNDSCGGDGAEPCE